MLIKESSCVTFTPNQLSNILATSVRSLCEICETSHFRFSLTSKKRRKRVKIKFIEFNATLNSHSTMTKLCKRSANTTVIKWSRDDWFDEWLWAGDYSFSFFFFLKRKNGNILAHPILRSKWESREFPCLVSEFRRNSIASCFRIFVMLALHLNRLRSNLRKPTLKWTKDSIMPAATW